jgi:gallate dioxygenase
VAEIVGALGVPHTPFFPSLVEREGPQCETARYFAALTGELEAMGPDLIVMFDTDHLNTFFLDNLPVFAIGVTDAFKGPNDEPRSVPIYTIKSRADVAAHLRRAAMEAAFDLALAQQFTVDHSIVVPLHFMTPTMRIPVIPIFVSGHVPPLPSARRCYELGVTIKRAIESWHEPLRVVVVGSGSFSLEVFGPRIAPGKSERGSGSNTVALDNVFVPEHRSVSFSTLRDACSPGSGINTAPIYRTPFIAVHTYALLGPALGLARGAYADFVQWTRQRYLTYTVLNVAQHVPVQIRVAEIAAQIDAAELLARHCFSIAREDYTRVTLEQRLLLRRDFTYAMRMVRAAMDDLIKISGSSGLRDDNSVQRSWRDVHAISSHVVMNFDVAGENFGRVEFGLGRNEAYPMF